MFFTKVKFAFIIIEEYPNKKGEILDSKVRYIFVIMVVSDIFSFSLEEFIYNYLITLSNYIIPKKGV